MLPIAVGTQDFTRILAAWGRRLGSSRFFSFLPTVLRPGDSLVLAVLLRPAGPTPEVAPATPDSSGEDQWTTN
jgi:hypothetical protein